jgi:hypothetical protein
MSIPIEIHTGLRDIVNLVNFVINSKFDISRFFGFDRDHNEEGTGEYMIDK